MNQRYTSCHERNGRAAPAPEGEILDKRVFKVADADGNPHPDLGSALQSRTVDGTTSEEQVSIDYWFEVDGLRSPVYVFSGVTPEKFSARIAPQLVGIGQLEAIPEATVLALEDEADSDGDWISGKANRIAGPITGETRLGRFGWTASTVGVRHQVASAFNMDMGVMTSVLPEPDCGTSQTDCGESGSELADEHVDNLVKYVSLLGVRPQRNYTAPAVVNGQALFRTIGCAACRVQRAAYRRWKSVSSTRWQNCATRPFILTRICCYVTWALGWQTGRRRRCIWRRMAYHVAVGVGIVHLCDGRCD